MHDVLVEDCIRKQGCCSRGCGCCPSRQLNSTCQLTAGHCALTCGFYRKDRGLNLPKRKRMKSTMRLISKQIRTSPIGFGWFLSGDCAWIVDRARVILSSQDMNNLTRIVLIILRIGIPILQYHIDLSSAYLGSSTILLWLLLALNPSLIAKSFTTEQKHNIARLIKWCRQQK